MRPLVLLSSLASGGAEQVTVAFLRALAEEGQHVPLCTLSNRRDDAPALEVGESGIVRHDLGARRLLDFRAFLRLLSLIRCERIDLVHAHGQDAAILGSWARPFGKFRFIVTRHVLDEPVGDRRQRIRAQQSLGAFRRADAAVAVSRAAADRLATLARLPLERIRVITNGIRLERFDPGSSGIHANGLRGSLGVGLSEPLVVVPAVLRPGKGHDVLLDSVPLVQERFPSARFALAGGGELEGELKVRAQNLGSAVLFLGHRRDIPELMAASDLVVLPSRAEALPTVAMEAAAAGRAMLASRVGGVEEVVSDGVTGIMVPPGDPRALAESMVALLGDPERRNALARAARLRALEEFGIETQVKRTLALWDEVCLEGGPKP
jgi:glycosyltransferase involved in cell wall biosynthesis